MSATNNFENLLMKHIFINSSVTNLGDAEGLRGSASAGSVWLALFSTDPGETGAGTELDYTNYARVEIPRTDVYFDVTGPTATNKTILNFGQNLGTSQTANNWALFTASTNGDMLFYGDVTIPLVIDTGVIPSVPVGSLSIQAN